MSNRSSRRAAQRAHRRHGHRRPNAVPDIFVSTFGDALAEAAALVDEFGRVFAGYVLDARGQVINGWALTGEHHVIDEVVLLVLAGEEPEPGTGVLLISGVVGSDVSTPQEEDELRWSSFRRVFARRGYHLWDWIKADGDAFRSLYLGGDGAGAWPAPPVGT